MAESAKVLTITSARGPVLISADVHGHREDFERLCEVFLASDARGEDPLWISVGDWVHGPAPERAPVLDGEGVPLYAYSDETPAILERYFALIDRYPGRVVSLCGNHEHAHIGGMRTSKFHRDEAAHLEARLTPERVTELRQRFASWPMIVRLAAMGVVLTHGAPHPGTVEEFDAIRYAGDSSPRSRELLRAAMTRYGFEDGEDLEVLARLSTDVPYHLLVHGHDREELGHCANGAAALLLCTSFGARRAFKTYLWLDRARRYASLAALRPGIELRRLY
ncbi:MAG: metallophosphoesterase [Proteobacteria bacterium]|nr:metallophosphoesterase [Pseudomonadota bacterium]